MDNYSLMDWDQNQSSTPRYSLMSGPYSDWVNQKGGDNQEVMDAMLRAIAASAPALAALMKPQVPGAIQPRGASAHSFVAPNVYAGFPPAQFHSLLASYLRR